MCNSNILLIRHLESTKNIDNSFSSSENLEPLTDQALKSGTDLGEQISVLSSVLNTRVKNVYCAKSERAISTARLISDMLKAKVISEEDLTSIRYSANGVSESNAKKDNPAFIRNLELYRKGLLSSYDIATPKGSEKLEDFEKRVDNVMNRIHDENQSGLIIVIAHRSSVTAALLRYARLYHNYPSRFFGYIELSFGYASLVQLSGEKPFIRYVNLAIEEILQKLQD